MGGGGRQSADIFNCQIIDQLAGEIETLSYWLKEAHERYNNLVYDYGSSEDENEFLRQELEKLRAEKSSWYTEIQRLKSQHQTEIEGLKDALENEKIKLQTEWNKKSKADQAQHEESCRTYEGQIDELKLLVKKLTDDLKQTELEKNAETEACALKGRAIETIQHLKSQSQSEVQELRDALEEKIQLETKWNEKETALKDDYEEKCKGYQGQIDTMGMMINQLKNDLKRTEDEKNGAAEACARQLKASEANCSQCQVWRNHFEASDAAVALGLQENENLSLEMNKLKGIVEKQKKQLAQKGIRTNGPSQYAEMEITKRAQEIAYLQKRYKELEDIIRAKDSAVKELSERLSAEMGKKVAADEKCLENINIKNRPMNIASEYENICSNEWLAAKDVLDNHMTAMDDKAKTIFLCRVFLITEKEACTRFDEFNSRLFQLFNSPFDTSGESSTKKTELPVELTNMAGDVLRNKADETEVSYIVKITSDCLGKGFASVEDIIQEEGIQTYIQACSRLAWKMAIQRPSMKFIENGLGEAWQGANRQDVCFSSSDPNNPRSRVDYFVHPSLWHGDALMVKGRVHLSCD